MKTNSIILAVIILSLLTTTTFARIWRVDNNSSNISDFTTLQAAHDGAATGDTLYVYGSGYTYGWVTLTKTLYIFGPGYFLDDNPETQVSTISAKAGRVYFDTGSGGSLLAGLVVEGSASAGSINIKVNNIIIKRNNILYDFLIQDLASNIIVVQNYMREGINVGDSFGNGNCQNIIIHNNYISDTGPIYVNPTSSADIRNNVLYERTNNSPSIWNSIFYNNIYIGNGNFVLNNCDVKNNIAEDDQFGTLNGNQAFVDMSTVFIGEEGSPDGQWQLAPDSPAIGAGIAGEDCGMFGGDEPYVLSGLPAIPAIWYFDAPISGSTNSGLQVNIKVKSHN